MFRIILRKTRNGRSHPLLFKKRLRRHNLPRKHTSIFQFGCCLNPKKMVFFGTPNIIHSAPKLEDPGRDQSEKSLMTRIFHGNLWMHGKDFELHLEVSPRQNPNEHIHTQGFEKGHNHQLHFEKILNDCMYIHIYILYIYILCLTLYNITTSTTWNLNEKSCQTYEFIIIHIIHSLYYLQLQPSEGKWTSIYLLWFRNSWCPCWWELVMPHLSWLKKKAQLLQDPVLGTCWASWAFFCAQKLWDRLHQVRSH